MPDGNGHRPTPPYFAFRTLLNTLERMEEPGPPPRIDRTFLDSMSGAGQTQFIAGLKSLSLVDENHDVTDRLIELVKQRDNRKPLIAQLLRDSYPEAVELGRTTATAGQLEETFHEVYGVRGDTARKAIAFYLKAAEYAEDIPLSPNFKTPSVKRTNGAAGGTRRRGKGGKAATSRQDESSGEGVATEVHPAVAGLLNDLPKKGGAWPSEEARALFLSTFEAVVNYAIPVAAEASQEEEDSDEAEDEEQGLGE